MNAQVLDPCSASRMMWFDKGDQRALFGDIRDEEHVLCDGRVLKVEPDVIMDFRHLPFPDASFNMVVFDPPHLVRAGRESWLRLKYGILTDEQPLFGHKSGKREKTHWITFMKHP